MCQRLGFIHGLLTWTQKFTTGWFGWFMVFNATFYNLSVISWWSDLLVEETRVPGEKPLTYCKSLTNFIP